MKRLGQSESKKIKLTFHSFNLYPLKMSNCYESKYTSFYLYAELPINKLTLLFFHCEDMAQFATSYPCELHCNLFTCCFHKHCHGIHVLRDNKKLLYSDVRESELARWELPGREGSSQSPSRLWGQGANHKLPRLRIISWFANVKLSKFGWK